jgi:DNA-binding response OmpR family regulator
MGVIYGISRVLIGKYRVHVLVIDVEYLVALEAEQLLTERLSATVDIVPPREALAVLQDRSFHVIFLDAAVLTKPMIDEVQRLSDTGTGVVFSSVDHSHRLGLPEFPGIPVISRPFDDQELVEQVRRAGR